MAFHWVKQYLDDCGNIINMHNVKVGVGHREKPHTGAAAREKPIRHSRHHERRAIFNCMVCRSSVNILSKLHRTLDSL